MIRYSEICEAPCAGVLERKGGEFFVSGRGYGPSKRFRLEGTSPTYTLRVTPRPKALVWLGYLTRFGFISGGTVGGRGLGHSDFAQRKPVAKVVELTGGRALRIEARNEKPEPLTTHEP
jgi:hypothetical protein